MQQVAATQPFFTSNAVDDDSDTALVLNHTQKFNAQMEVQDMAVFERDGSAFLVGVNYTSAISVFLTPDQNQQGSGAGIAIGYIPPFAPRSAPQFGGIAVDSDSNRLFLSDVLFHRIFKVDLGAGKKSLLYDPDPNNPVLGPVLGKTKLSGLIRLSIDKLDVYFVGTRRLRDIGDVSIIYKSPSTPATGEELAVVGMFQGFTIEDLAICYVNGTKEVVVSMFNAVSTLVAAYPIVDGKLGSNATHKYMETNVGERVRVRCGDRNDLYITGADRMIRYNETRQEVRNVTLNIGRPMALAITLSRSVNSTIGERKLFVAGICKGMQNTLMNVCVNQVTTTVNATATISSSNSTSSTNTTLPLNATTTSPTPSPTASPSPKAFEFIVNTESLCDQRCAALPSTTTTTTTRPPASRTTTPATTESATNETTSTTLYVESTSLATASPSPTASTDLSAATSNATTTSGASSSASASASPDVSPTPSPNKTSAADSASTSKALTSTLDQSGGVSVTATATSASPSPASSPAPTTSTSIDSAGDLPISAAGVPAQGGNGTSTSSAATTTATTTTSPSPSPTRSNSGGADGEPTRQPPPPAISLDLTVLVDEDEVEELVQTVGNVVSGLLSPQDNGSSQRGAGAQGAAQAQAAE
ncbi:hypothetical protein HK102_013219 [Quaeritorhiza haematococci]|nr:hypothetical protein HK102_013219 [Quaeritorhiza haematococci]